MKNILFLLILSSSYQCSTPEKISKREKPIKTKENNLLGLWTNVKHNINKEDYMKFFSIMNTEDNLENRNNIKNQLNNELNKYYRITNSDFYVYSSLSNFCNKNIYLKNTYEANDTLIRINNQINHFYFKNDSLIITYNKKGISLNVYHIRVPEDICFSK